MCHPGVLYKKSLLYLLQLPILDLDAILRKSHTVFGDPVTT